MSEVDMIYSMIHVERKCCVCGENSVYERYFYIDGRLVDGGLDTCELCAYEMQYSDYWDGLHSNECTCEDCIQDYPERTYLLRDS